MDAKNETLKWKPTHTHKGPLGFIENPLSFSNEISVCECMWMLNPIIVYGLVEWEKLHSVLVGLMPSLGLPFIYCSPLFHLPFLN